MVSNFKQLFIYKNIKNKFLKKGDRDKIACFVFPINKDE